MRKESTEHGPCCAVNEYTVLYYISLRIQPSPQGAQWRSLWGKGPASGVGQA